MEEVKTMHTVPACPSLEVLWVRRGQLPVPVVGETQHLELLSEPIHVALCGHPGVGPSLRKRVDKGVAMGLLT